MADAQLLLKSTRRAAGHALIGALAASAAGGVATIAAAWVLSGIIDAVAFSGAGREAQMPAILLLALCFVLRALLALAADQLAFRAGAGARREMFRLLIDRVGALGPVRLVDLPTGEAVALMTDAVAAIEPYWRRWIPALTTSALVPGAILLAVLPQDVWSAAIILCSLPLLFLFLYLAGLGADAANRRQWASLTRLGGHLLDAVQGLTELKIFRAAKAEIAVVRKMANAYRRDTMAVLRLAFLSALVLEFFATVAIAVVAVTIGFRLLWGTIDFHAGFFILLLAPEFYAPLRAMGVQRHARMEAVAAAEKLADFLDRETGQGPGGRETLAQTDAVGLRFEDVHLSYGGEDALTGLSFAIAPGAHVALAGASGAGKSTMFALLLGFIAARSGRVLVNGVPLQTLDPAHWRALIAYVPQRPHLFDGDVDDNVAMGRMPPGDARDAMVAAALRSARAEDFVSRLPDGRKTRLGENGIGLSGGEAQRLSLARAFFRPAPLVLLDEPSAHLDPHTEAEVDAAIDALTKGRTRITIAHRISALRAADEVLLLEAGRLAMRGHHDVLIAAGGAYAALTRTAREGGEA